MTIDEIKNLPWVFLKDEVWDGLTASRPGCCNGYICFLCKSHNCKKMYVTKRDFIDCFKKIVNEFSSELDISYNVFYHMVLEENMGYLDLIDFTFTSHDLTKGCVELKRLQNALLMPDHTIVPSVLFRSTRTIDALLTNDN